MRYFLAFINNCGKENYPVKKISEFLGVEHKPVKLELYSFLSKRSNDLDFVKENRENKSWKGTMKILELQNVSEDDIEGEIFSLLLEVSSFIPVGYYCLEDGFNPCTTYESVLNNLQCKKETFIEFIDSLSTSKIDGLAPYVDGNSISGGNFDYSYRYFLRKKASKLIDEKLKEEENKLQFKRLIE